MSKNRILRQQIQILTDILKTLKPQLWPLYFPEVLADKLTDRVDQCRYLVDRENTDPFRIHQNKNRVDTCGTRSGQKDTSLAYI